MSSKRGIYIFTLIGLVLGITLDSLIHYQNQTLFYYVFISLFALLYALTFNEKHLFRLIGSSFIVALFLSLPLLPIREGYKFIHLEHWISFLGALPIFIYIGHSFHYAYHHDNTWKVKYSSLFAAVWNTIPLLFIACIFSGLANSLIVLAAFIFKTVGNIYLWNLYFENEHFRLISNITLFFIGLGIGQQNISIINSLRFLLLRMMYYLFPFLAFISMLYFILYLIHSPASKEYINPLFILIPLVSLGILFFNAYYQDGEDTVEREGPSWLKLSLKVYRVILLVLTLMMTYRIFQESSLDVNLFICILTLILYSLLYALTAWFPENKEKRWIQRGNIGCALFFVIMLFLLNIPYMPIAFNVGAESKSTLLKINQVNNNL